MGKDSYDIREYVTCFPDVVASKCVLVIEEYLKSVLATVRD